MLVWLQKYAITQNIWVSQINLVYDSDPMHSSERSRRILTSEPAEGGWGALFVNILILFGPLCEKCFTGK